MPDQTPARAPYTPTPDEIQLLELLASGLQIKQSATRLGISRPAATVRASRLRYRLGAASNTQAIHIATGRGILPSPLSAEAEYRRAGWDTATRELVGLRAALDAINHLHREFRLYGECGHRHTEEGDGVVSVENIGLTCHVGYERSICRECCTSGSDYQTEECATNHGGACWPCRTQEAAVHVIADAMRGDQSSTAPSDDYNDDLIPDRRHVPPPPPRAHAHVEVPRG